MIDGPLTVLYDAGCSLCRAARDWLAAQPQWVELVFVPAGSAEALRRFPGLTAEETLRELHVVDADGGVYGGADAWLMCLWALEHYRSLSLSFARPGRRQLAERFVGWVARHRPRHSGDDGA